MLLFLRLGTSCHAVNVRRPRIDMIPFAVAPPSTHLEALSSRMGELLGRIDAAPPLVPLDSLEQQVVMEENTVETQFSFSFMTEEGRNVSDYTVTVECSNHAVLRVEDVEVGPPILMENGRANYTLSVTFERQVGEVELSVVFRTEDRAIYTNLVVHYIVCGISFFSYDTRTMIKTLLPNNEFLISTFHDLLDEELLVFYVFVQFPDGSTSETDLSNLTKVPNLSTLTISLQGDKLLPDHNFRTCLTNHGQLLDNGTIALEPTCNFGFTSFRVSKPLFFAVRLLRQKTGHLLFHFRWGDFLRGTLFDELFETSLSIRVTGKVPASIVSFIPPGPFRKSGGQLLDCIIISASPTYKFYLTIGNSTSTPIARRVSSANQTVLSFVTPPGAGRNVPWDLKYSAEGSEARMPCLWAGESDRYIFNYLAEDIIIKSLSPAFGPVAGGTLVNCAGYFGGFNASLSSGDVIMLGSFTLEKKHIVSVTATSLVFMIPSMQTVQSLSYEIECYVIVHGILSNTVTYTYESLTDVTIEITGASYEARNNTFLVPMCGSGTIGPDYQSISLMANVNSGAPLKRLQFMWRIVVFTTKAEVVNAHGLSEAQSLSVPLSKFSVRETYEVILVTSDERFNTQVKASIRLQPTKLRRLGVGLSLDHSRTISLPPVDTRVTATVTELGECHGSNKTLTYDWTFMSVTRTLTSTSNSVEIELASPRRLGREYIVPRNKLVYGRHNITVKVYYTLDPNTFGTATTWLSVEPAPLQPVIGSGESLIRVPSSEDLEISSALSYDPDSDSKASQDTLYFEWHCELSTEGKEMFKLFTECPDSFLPFSHAKRLMISSDILNTVQFIDGLAHVRYSLVVRKSYGNVGTRSSARVSQVIEIIRTEDVYAVRGSLSLSDFDGGVVHTNRVPYYEGVVLSVAAPVGSSWRFRLLEPVAESFTFLQNPNNFLMSPGFYNPKELTAGKNALGIRGGALQPGTDYKFEVEYESRNADRTTKVEVRIQTIPRATVTFLPMLRTSGTTKTLFSAMASPSVKYYGFKYYFYIKLSDGSEMCIDGCSGQRQVSFRIPIVGNHTVRCALVDARGKIVIHKATRVQSIVIYDAPRNDSQMNTQTRALEDTFDLGDHSGFEMESMKLATYARQVDVKSRATSEQIADVVGQTVSKLAEMYRKTQPNTALAKDYALITRSFASIPEGSEALADEETFYSLCRMLYFAVSNTPAWERYDMTNEVKVTLEKLATHARQIYEGGWSRRRLVAYRAVESFNVNEALLALNELVLPLFFTMLSRGEPCGHLAMANLSGIGTIRVQVGCNREQGLGIIGMHSHLEWCEKVYEQERRRRVAFALGEFGDYIAESEVLSLRTRIEKPNVEIGNDGSVAVETEHMTSQGYVIVKTAMKELDGEKEGVEKVRKGCFRVVQDVKASDEIFGGDVECEGASAIEYRNLKGLDDRKIREGDYAETRLKSSRVEGRANREEHTRGVVRVGVGIEQVHGRTFGVKRFECRDLRPVIVGEDKWWWIGAVGVVGILVVTVVLGIVQLGLRGRREGKGVDGDDGGPYIERDVYGRGLGLEDQEDLEVEKVWEEAEDEGDDEVVFENATPRHRTATD